MSAHLRIAADVGGTFTDVAVFDESSGHIRLGKTLTTPQRLIDGMGHGVEKASARFADASLFLHGTTVAINALLGLPPVVGGFVGVAVLIFAGAGAAALFVCFAIYVFLLCCLFTTESNSLSWI